MESATSVNLLTHIPPPLLFVATFLAGVGLQRIDPLFHFSAGLVMLGQYLGAILISGGVLLAITCIGLFVKSRTTLIPFATANTLVTRGPYRFTRNPMYLSLVITYLGAVSLLAEVWSLLLLPLPVALISAVVIPSEETRLHEKFGASFEAYCARVRRWF